MHTGIYSRTSSRSTMFKVIVIISQNQFSNCLEPFDPSVLGDLRFLVLWSFRESHSAGFQLHCVIK